MNPLKKNFTMLLLIVIASLHYANAMFFPLYAITKRMEESTFSSQPFIAQCFETGSVASGDVITGSFEISGTQEGMHKTYPEKI
jgi:hypothetical protein